MDTIEEQAGAPVVEAPKASDVVTEKSFAELTNDDLKGMSTDEVENYARGQGWQSAENFRGDPKRVKTAMQFINDGKTELPIIKANNKRLANENEQIRKEMANNNKILMDKMAKQDARHKKDLESKLKEAEGKRDRAKTEFDVDTATKEAENVINFQNELNTIEDDSKQKVATAEANTQARLDEWYKWLGSEESMQLQSGTAKDFESFRQEVVRLDSQNKNADVSDIIAKAKATIYKQVPSVQGANPSKTKASTSRVTSEERAFINSNIANETQMMRNRGATKEAIQAHVKKQTKFYEDTLAKEQE